MAGPATPDAGAKLLAFLVAGGLLIAIASFLNQAPRPSAGAASSSPESSKAFEADAIAAASDASAAAQAARSAAPASVSPADVLTAVSSAAATAEQDEAGLLGPPSFDCAKVMSQNLQLVCAVPALSADDREVVDAYQRALLAATDIATLTREKREWVVYRNNAPYDLVTLHRIYRDRIDQLNANNGG
jgi:hypothetical protein